GIAVSSYQGGHMEFFKYMLDLLRERDGAHIKVFGGGGGVILPSEIEELQDYGVTRIFSPEDGARLGLQGMIDEMIGACRRGRACEFPSDWSQYDVTGDEHRLWPARTALAHLITALESQSVSPEIHADLLAIARSKRAPVLGITGTGGA